MLFYHATTEDAYQSIVNDGEIKVGFDKIVYLADSDLNSRKFIGLRAFGKPIIVIEIDIPEEEMDKVEETFDHNEAFFCCKAYGYRGSIPYDWVTGVWKYF